MKAVQVSFAAFLAAAAVSVVGAVAAPSAEWRKGADFAVVTAYVAITATAWRMTSLPVD